MPEGTGFSGGLRRMKGQPGPENVGCSDDVSVRFVPAPDAPEHGLRRAVVADASIPAAYIYQPVETVPIHQTPEGARPLGTF